MSRFDRFQDADEQPHLLSQRNATPLDRQVERFSVNQTHGEEQAVADATVIANRDDSRMVELSQQRDLTLETQTLIGRELAAATEHFEGHRLVRRFTSRAVHDPLRSPTELFGDLIPGNERRRPRSDLAGRRFLDHPGLLASARNQSLNVIQARAHGVSDRARLSFVDGPLKN
jgi:hypothetical protein